MKCFVLAGGSGDALWPISRKNYPKQFINIREGRSLFQEAIARNLPFCDEFYIITNEKYRYIVEGQMQAFQGLHYHCLLEEMGRQTAPAVAIAAMCVDASEKVLVISTDHLIDEGDYNGTILRAQEQLEDGKIVVIGCNPVSGATGDTESANLSGHSAFLYKMCDVMDFVPKCARYDDLGLFDDKGNNVLVKKDGYQVLLDSGIFLMHAGTYLEAIQENASDLYEKCQTGHDRTRLTQSGLVITKEWLSTIPSLSIGECVFAKWAGKRVKIVEADFHWSRLLDLETLTGKVSDSLRGPSILENCEDVSVYNENKKQLVVVNDCRDLVVVSTKDATYVSKKGHSSEIKQIMGAHYEEAHALFDEGDIYYTTWGIKETLNRSAGYLVKKLTIFPGKSLTMHKHELRSEHWSIVSGTATISMNGETREYQVNESIYVPIGTFHQISNEMAKDLIVIEVSVGSSVGGTMADIQQQSIEEFVKLSSSCKEYLWGGYRLHRMYGKCLQEACALESEPASKQEQVQSNEQKIAESWEVSAHRDGPSTIASGTYQGLSFPEYLEEIGRNALGWKCRPFERFPLLIKFIDAASPLSVQVHPSDAYAMEVEGEYGKNEMWYVMDAGENAAVYLGFSKDITEEECRQRIKDGNLSDVLRRIPVKKGDVIFVSAGTVHAILENLMVLEIQQSSNSTYRLYDYDRVDKNGKKRELHLDKAMANLDFSACTTTTTPMGEKEQGKGYLRQTLGECKYFSAVLYEVEEEMELSLDESTFSAIVFFEGSGSLGAGITQMEFVAGDSFFVPAAKKVLKIRGKCKFVLSRV